MVNNLQKLEQLNKQLDIFSNLSHCVDGTAIIIDTDAKILFCSDSVYDLLGYTVEELIGQSLSILIHPINNMQHNITEELKKHSKNILNNNSELMCTGRDVYAKHKDGRAIRVHTYASEIKNNNSILFLGIMRGIK